MSERRILLVEDSPYDAELTILALKDHDVANEVVVARDGAEALAYLHGPAAGGPEALPILTLLDLKLPRVSGFEVLRKIREDPRTKNLAVVVLTSSKQEEDIVASYDLGANAYVRKPVDFAQLTEAVRALSLFWLIHNQPAPPIRTAKVAPGGGPGQ